MLGSSIFLGGLIMSLSDIFRAYNHACVTHNQEDEKKWYLEILKLSLRREPTQRAR